MNNFFFFFLYLLLNELIIKKNLFAAVFHTCGAIRSFADARGLRLDALPATLGECMPLCDENLYTEYGY